MALPLDYRNECRRADRAIRSQAATGAGVIQAGKLRHRIAIQSLTAGSPQQTGSGMPDESWGTVVTVSASIEPLNGRELFAALEHHAETTTRIRIRYRSGVTAKMRVSHGGTIYNILSVIDSEKRHKEMQLMCSDGVNEG